MKRILDGYKSLLREIVGLQTEPSYLWLPASMSVLIAICAVIGFVRNAISVAAHAPGFYSFDPDIVWTMITFPVNLFLFPGALLHWQLRLLGYRNLDVNTIFGLAFHLQLYHLFVPFIDTIGFSLGMPPMYIIGDQAIANEWYTNLLYMTPGIIVGWWVTAYTVARVFRTRLGISWFATIFTSMTTFTVILIPTYIIFPTLNTLFSHAFGPWLWSPLKYIAMTPKWFPFWGNGTYFALTALLGFIYYVKHSRDENTRSLFQINSPTRAYAWLFGFGIARTILDYVWVPIYAQSIMYKIIGLFHTTVYIFTLYLVIPTIAGVILRRLFSKPVDDHAVLRESVLVWIVYPLVAVISLIMKSPPLRTVEWFRYIPTFMIDYNFLPAGMIAVIPVLIIFYTWLLMRHSKANGPKVLFAVIMSLLIVYLIYYQYTARLFLYIFYSYGPFIAFGYYTLAYLIPLFPLAGRFDLAFNSHRIRLSMLVTISAIVCIILMIVGWLQLLLT